MQHSVPPRTAASGACDALRRGPPAVRALRGAGRVCLLSALLAAVAPAQEAPRRDSVTVDAAGTIHADGLVVPLSDFLSPEARAQITARLRQGGPSFAGGDVIDIARQASAGMLAPVLLGWQQVYPATITRVTMTGVATDVVVPTAGIAPANRHRVLINLHGGGFFTGAGLGGQVESVPMAGRGRIKVVSVDYRLAPEAHFPAASEDVERVYRALLKQYRPGDIGIYGCSAGGTLVAQSLAWFQRKGLPRPGAAGIFCSGAMPTFWYGGDGLSLGPMLNGRHAPTADEMKGGPGTLYLAGTDPDDPLVTPGLFPATLARFPPTLILTSTRDSAMSNAIVTNLRLLQAGVETQLLVLEGLGHGEFTTIPGTPEAAQAFDVIWRFFDRHLGRGVDGPSRVARNSRRSAPR